ncbi:MAG: antibiotic biosynthesis monooxygenase [Gammaproteobacteria bacterium]
MSKDHERQQASAWIATTPEPPYYAVIFTSARTAADDDGYAAMAERMVELAADQPGFLGVESVRDGRPGITVSYWRSREDIAAWRAHAEHRVAQERGRADWYAAYCLRVAKVERENRFQC